MSLPFNDLVAAERLRQNIYDRPGGGVGCCLHIVLDDGNVDDSHVEWCHIKAIDNGHHDCVMLATYVLRMSKTQRTKMYHRGYVNIAVPQ